MVVVAALLMAWLGVRSGAGHAVGDEGTWDGGTTPREPQPVAATTADADGASLAASATAAESAPADAESAATAEEFAAEEFAAEERPVAETAVAEGAADPESADDPQSVAGADPPAIPARAVRDRLAGVLDSLGEAQTVVEIVRAAVAARHAAELPLEAAQRAALAAACEALAERLRRRIDWLAERAVRGRIVAEQREWQALLGIDEPALAGVVDAGFTARGWSLPVGAGRSDAVPASVAQPDSTPLQRGQLVRCRIGPAGDAEFAEGRVVAVRGERITVKVEDASGLRFPAVDWCDCEPLELDGGGAARWARHAAARGESGLAVAWAVAASGCAERPLAESQRVALWRELAGR